MSHHDTFYQGIDDLCKALAEFQRRALGLRHRIGDQVTVGQFWGLYEATIVGYGVEHNGHKAIPVYDLKTPTGDRRGAYKDQVDA